MVCKEAVCLWFQKLNPHTRIDIMCGLLQMCVPPELRFLGSYLEDLGKKDYHRLRDAEIKANNHIDLAKNTNTSIINNSSSNTDSSTSSGSTTTTGAGSSNNSSSSSSISTEENLRNKLSLSLALLYSSNRQCSNILFKLLEANVERALQVMPSMAVVTIHQILTILVMAANHPAFTFKQQLTMAELYKSAEKASEGLIPKDECLCCHTCASCQSPPKPDIGPHLCSRCAPRTSPTHKEKAHVTRINVKGTRKLLNKQTDFIMQVSWSNGEMTEVYKTFHEVQEFSNKFLRMFDDVNMHKQDRRIPFLQSQYKDEHLEDVNLPNVSYYIGQLEKLPQKFLECDYLVNFFAASASSRSSHLRSTDFPPANEQPVIYPYHLKSFSTVSPSCEMSNRQLPHPSPYYTPPHYSQLSSNSHGNNNCRTMLVNNQLNAPSQGISPMYSPSSSPPPPLAASSLHSSLQQQQSNSRSGSPASVDGNSTANSKQTNLEFEMKDEEKTYFQDVHKNSRDKRHLNGLIDYSILAGMPPNVQHPPGGAANMGLSHLTWQQHHAAAAAYKPPFHPAAIAAAAAQQQQQQQQQQQGPPPQAPPPRGAGMTPSPVVPVHNPMGMIYCFPHTPPILPQVSSCTAADSSPGGSDYCSQPPSPGPPSVTSVTAVAASSSSVASDDSDRVKNGKEVDQSFDQDFRKKEKPNLKLQQQLLSKATARPQPEEQTKGSLHLPLYLDFGGAPGGYNTTPPELLATIPPHRPPPVQGRSAYKAQPAHTNLGINPKNMINMPPDGKSNSPMVPLLFSSPGGLHNPDTTNMTTTVITSTTPTSVLAAADSTGGVPPVFAAHLPSTGVRTRTGTIHPPPCTRTVACTNSTLMSTCSSNSSPPPRHTIGNVKNNSVCPHSVPQSLPAAAAVASDPTCPSSSDQTGGGPAAATVNFLTQCSNQNNVTTNTITNSSQAFNASSPSQAGTGRSRMCKSCGCDGHCNPGSFHPISVITSPLAGPTNNLPHNQWQTFPPNTGYMLHSSNGLIPLSYAFSHNILNGISSDLMYNNPPNINMVHMNTSNQVTAASSSSTSSCMLNQMCGYGVVGQHAALPQTMYHTMTSASNKHCKTCFNCGGANHFANDCKENSMETMTGHFHLNYKSKAAAD